MIWTFFARSEVVEREGPFVGPLVGLEVGSLVGVHPTVAAKLGYVCDALADVRTAFAMNE
jgi:hypothetical protein